MATSTGIAGTNMARLSMIANVVMVRHYPREAMGRIGESD